MRNYDTMITALYEQRAELYSDAAELIEAAAMVGDVISSDELDAQNAVDPGELFTEFFDLVVARLMDGGMSEDDAAGLFMAVAEELSEQGDVPALPMSEDSVDSFDFVGWLAAARSAGFEQLVYSAAEE